jgi:hypothetical protein
MGTSWTDAVEPFASPTTRTSVAASAMNPFVTAEG